MTFGERLRKYRKEVKLTQEQLSQKSGLAVINISQYERGVYTPKPEAGKKLADALGVSVPDLYGWDDESARLAAEIKTIEQQEKDLLQAFRGLNSEGQEILIEYITFLSGFQKYQREE